MPIEPKEFWDALAVVLFAMFIAAAVVHRAHPQTLDVDVALVLVLDVSDSVNEDEFTLQRVGTAAALVDPAIVNAINGGALGRVAVSVVEFATQAKVIVPWTVISDAKSARAFANTLTGVPRPTELGSFTSISTGLTFARNLIVASPYRATRIVVDVSGDGDENSEEYSDGGLEGVTASLKALKAIVNGLAILNEDADVETFYREHVVVGPGAFVIPTKNYQDFLKAIRRKLIREIS